MEFGVPPGDASNHTNISVKTIQRLRKQARARGFDPAVSSLLKIEYVEDAPRSGRPPKLNPELEETIVASFVGERIRDGEEKMTQAQVAEATGVSTTTIRRVLAARGVVFEQKTGNHAIEDGASKIAGKKARPPKGKEKEVSVQSLSVHNSQSDREDLRINPVDEFGGRLDPLLAAETRPGVVF